MIGSSGSGFTSHSRSVTTDDRPHRWYTSSVPVRPAGPGAAAADQVATAVWPGGHRAAERDRDGDAALTPVFWGMVVLTGVAAGLFGDLMMLLLFTVQRLAFGWRDGSLATAVSQTSDARRVAADGRGARSDRMVPAAPPDPGRENRDRRRGLRGGGAALVPPVAGHLRDLRGHHRDGCLDRPRERAQADGRRRGRRAGRGPRGCTFRVTPRTWACRPTSSRCRCWPGRC